MKRKSEKSDTERARQESERMLDTHAAADHIGMSYKTLKNYRVNGSAKSGPRCYKDDRGRAWYKVADLDAWNNTRKAKVDGSLLIAKDESPDVVEWKAAEAERLQQEEEERIAKIKREVPVAYPIGTVFAGKAADRPDLYWKITELSWCREGKDIYRCMKSLKKENRWRADIIDIHKDDLQAQREWIYGKENIAEVDAQPHYVGMNEAELWVVHKAEILSWMNGWRKRYTPDLVDWRRWKPIDWLEDAINAYEALHGTEFIIRYPTAA